MCTLARYGVPSFFTEYEANLGQAVDDPVMVSSGAGNAEVWIREFDLGFVIVSSITNANITVTLPQSVREIPLSKDLGRITGQREAPAWQLVIDNDLGAPGSFVPGGPDDWWAAAAHRARFQTIEGNWTVVSDQTQSHQYGDSFLVAFNEPGGLSGTSNPCKSNLLCFLSFILPDDFSESESQPPNLD